MPKAGRRRSAVWACFTENTASGKRRVLCLFCHHDLVANPIRMVRHIVRQCPNADEHHKKICREYQALTVPARRRPVVGGQATEAAKSADALELESARVHSDASAPPTE
ncbi:hypothetical protein P43SY_001391 [Pythium insidiosum]|uniref:BED-type domain-containing protein n=1 Tax=Pythium insidiosum TaxID=114742 RepID=A0AAD5QCA6_PYTIN|nr:hypothetical protein P43SY_001391 [Pythium insidiosum]